MATEDKSMDPINVSENALDGRDDRLGTVICFEAWLKGCIAVDKPVFTLKREIASALNGLVIDQAIIDRLAAALVVRDRNLSLSATLALCVLRHHQHRRLCESVCRVIRTRLRLQDATADLANALGCSDLDEPSLLDAAKHVGLRLGAMSDGEEFGPPSAVPPAKRRKRPSAILVQQTAMQVALGTAFMQRQISADAASRLFLEAMSVANPGRRSFGATGLIAVLKARPASAAPISEVFAIELRAFEAESRRARNEESVARERVFQLEAEIESLRVATTDLVSKLQLSHSEVASLKERLEDDDRLARDREESLRARVGRRLNSDVAMLQEGLDAIRREPPRVKVMEDHADRVCESLRKELEQLNSGG
jgi:hypothetical protein